MSPLPRRLGLGTPSCCAFARHRKSEPGWLVQCRTGFKHPGFARPTADIMCKTMGVPAAACEPAGPFPAQLCSDIAAYDRAFNGGAPGPPPTTNEAVNEKLYTFFNGAFNTMTVLTVWGFGVRIADEPGQEVNVQVAGDKNFVTFRFALDEVREVRKKIVERVLGVGAMAPDERQTSTGR